MAKVNTYKSSNVNKDDTFSFEEKTITIGINDINSIKDKLVILYVYQLPDFQQHGLKVGMTTCNLQETIWQAIKSRIDSQTNELALDEDSYKKYGYNREVLFWGICINDLDGDFKDHRIHAELMNKYPGQIQKNQEWFTNVPLDGICQTFQHYRDSNCSQECEYPLRGEQTEAIDKLVKYFKKQNDYEGRFLLNCKMRFGKCYTVYNYAQTDNVDKKISKKILILTFVPAVAESWKEDLKHIKTRYQYFTDDDLKKKDFMLNDNPKTPYVVFVSLQNLLGFEATRDSAKRITKEKIEKLGKVSFDLLILDEYHFGAWNNRTQSQIEKANEAEDVEDIKDETYLKEIEKGVDPVNRFKLKVKQTICLSGTPFKALERNEFEPDAIYTYTYFDEQKRKYPNYANENLEDFQRTNPVSPYDIFPDMSIHGYVMSNLFGGLDETFYNTMDVLGSKNNYFSLNTFFKTLKDFDPTCREDKFVYEKEVKQWLDLLVYGKPGDKSIFPYQLQLRNMNRHSLWLLPTVNSCLAMEQLLRQDYLFFNNYNILNLSAPGVGSGSDALRFLNSGIGLADTIGMNGTIALTVNKLTLGVTVPEWSAVFVLKDLTSPEQYFQSIFRIQNPYIVNGENRKPNVNVYDFNIDRAAALIIKFASYEEEGEYRETLKIPDLILKFMPIYMDGNMERSIDSDVLYRLISLNDSGGKPISKMIKQIDKVAYVTSDMYANMANDPRIEKIFGDTFAYTKFKTNSKKKTKIGDVETNQTSAEFKQGQNIGFDFGKANYQKFVYLDDSVIQSKVDDEIRKLQHEKCPTSYDETQKINFYNGIELGVEKGIGVPIEKMKCGDADGCKFAENLKKDNSDLIYKEETKPFIINQINRYLNDDNNIPTKYKGKIFNKFYKSSFKSGAIRTLKPPIKKGEKTQEDFNNRILHILAKLFQFLYISVYRETTFSEIFANANEDIFKAAVGITKDDFEYLNSYKLFNEDYLNSCIRDFFRNEMLGKDLPPEEQNNGNYRNSFNWFGFGVEN